jgi:hypothetical protein
VKNHIVNKPIAVVAIDEVPGRFYKAKAQKQIRLALEDQPEVSR